jgi:hypothetical protein
MRKLWIISWFSIPLYKSFDYGWAFVKISVSVSALLKMCWVMLKPYHIRKNIHFLVFTIFSVVCWSLWKCRNDLIFNNKNACTNRNLIILIYSLFNIDQGWVREINKRWWNTCCLKRYGHDTVTSTTSSYVFGFLTCLVLCACLTVVSPWSWLLIGTNVGYQNVCMLARYLNGYCLGPLCPVLIIIIFLLRSRIWLCL